MLRLSEPSSGNQGKGVTLHSSLGEDADQASVTAEMG